MEKGDSPTKNHRLQILQSQYRIVPIVRESFEVITHVRYPDLLAAAGSVARAVLRGGALLGGGKDDSSTESQGS